MPLRDKDYILIDPDCIAYLESLEVGNKAGLSKFEIIEYFFEWLKKQPQSYQVEFLKEALSDEEQ